MTTELLKENLRYYSDNHDNISVSVYVLLKNQESLEPKKLDIEDTALSTLKDLFLENIKNNITDNTELELISLSSSDERLDAIYLYDIEVPSELQTMNTVISTDDISLFDYSDNRIADIKALLIEIGNDEKQIVLYKTMAPVNIFCHGHFFLKKENHRFKEIDDEFLRISSGYQLLYVENHYVVIDLVTIEKFFGFHEIIKGEAQKGIDAISNTQLIENSDVLSELIQDVKYARRFTKIAKSSPVLKANISNANIIDFCKVFPELKGKIRFNSTEDKILLDTKISKDLFIKLMMDDFLTSELTKFHYKTKVKDSVEKSDGDST